MSAAHSEKQDRLAEALRANLRRRKDQARARQEPPSQTPTSEEATLDTDTSGSTSHPQNPT